LFLDCFCENDTFKLFFDFANFTIKKTIRNNLAKLFFEETIEKKLKKNHATSWGLTILELADHALFKMVRYVLLRALRPELDGQAPFQTF
jgi:hypothetical protein